MPVLDPPYRDWTDDDAARQLPGELARARVDILAAAADLLAIPEDRLAADWAWTGEGLADIRYGAYRAAEALEVAEIEARRVAAPFDGDEAHAARIIAPATAARWDLGGLLLPIDDALLDADPGGDEWTIRLTLGHIISGQRAYGWGTAWWLANPHRVEDPDLPKGPPESLWTDLPDETTTEAEGNGPQLRARLDAVVDIAAERLAGLPDAVLSQGARWSGAPVTIAFRLGRWSSHIREHTIQVEKTLALLGHVPDERARLARHLLAAYGRAESAVFGRRASPGVDDGAGRIAEAAAKARDAVSRAGRAAVASSG